MREAFSCCSKRCRTYDAGLLVQLGYDGEARPLLFVPEWTDVGMRFPTEGLKFEPENQPRLEALTVSTPPPAPGSTRTGLLH